MIHDTAASEEVTREMVERYGVKALMDSELIISDGVFGDFAVHHHTAAGQFDTSDVGFLERVAAAVTLALRNAHLFARLQATADRTTFLADLVEHSSQPFLVSRPDGHLLMANQAFVGLFGYTPDRQNVGLAEAGQIRRDHAGIGDSSGTTARK